MIPAKHVIEDDGVTHSPNCWPCKQQSVNFAPSAMPNRNPTAARAKVGDKLLEKDREAYQGLRRNGERPKHVGGSAHLAATANESFEITTGRIEPDPIMRIRAREAFRDMPGPSTDPIVREDADV